MNPSLYPFVQHSRQNLWRHSSNTGIRFERSPAKLSDEYICLHEPHFKGVSGRASLAFFAAIPTRTVGLCELVHN